MDKIWLASYPPGVPETIAPPRHQSLVELVDAACREFHDRPALGNFGTQIDYTTLARRSRDVAAYLQAVCGVEPGDRIALMMPNMLAYPVVLLGALRAGATVVNTNPLYTSAELAHMLEDAGVKVLIVFAQALHTVAALPHVHRPAHLIVASLGDCMPRWKGCLFNALAGRRAAGRTAAPASSVKLSTALAHGAGLDFIAPTISADKIAFLQYTGGTTGRPKAAMLSHGNIVANVTQVSAWFHDHTERGHEVVITALPLYHIYALTTNCFATLAAGGLVYLITDPRDLKRFVKELSRVPFTTMTGVNTLFSALLDHPDFAQLDFSRLKFTSAGGMAVQRVVAERWQAVTGCVLAEGYGLTEASPVVTVNRHDVDTFTGSIGLPVPSTEIAIIDEDGRELGVEEAGELLVRGPQIMHGYWNDDSETTRVLDADGWLHTGDIARIDSAGYLYLVDRKKDVIVVSGFNVYPTEIEDVVVAHPGVREAAAIGEADTHSGESVCLVVVRADPTLTEEDVVRWCRERLTGYKIPRRVAFADALPKSPVGKILKRDLRERYAEKALAP